MLDAQVIVPDISIYQKVSTDPVRIDFSQMYHAGARGVMIRAGLGLQADPVFLGEYGRAMDHRLALLNYWFLKFTIPVVTQVQAYLNTIKNVGIPPYYEIDYEDRLGITYPTKPQRWLTETVKRVFDGTGEYATIYSSPGYWMQYPGTDPIFAKCPLHVAHWDKVVPMIPKPWTKAILHQYDVQGVGYDFGVQSPNIDLSIAKISLEELYRLVKQPYKTYDAMSDAEKLDWLEAIHVF